MVSALVPTRRSRWSWACRLCQATWRRIMLACSAWLAWLVPFERRQLRSQTEVMRDFVSRDDLSAAGIDVGKPPGGDRTVFLVDQRLVCFD